jgi:hypothetical protein
VLHPAVLMRKRLAGYVVTEHQHERRHRLVRRPVELFAFRVWPATIVAIWAIVLYTGGLIQTGDLLPQILTVTAMASSVAHFFFPLNTRVRYIALVTNEVAMLNRAVAYIFYDDPPLSSRVEWLALALWGGLFMAKLCMFMVTTAIVGYERARKAAEHGVG